MNNNDLWQTIIKRKVLRSLGIYLGGAWLALQTGSMVVEIWQLPYWTIQALFILLVLGIPLTGIFAWKYDITEKGIVRTLYSGITGQPQAGNKFLSGTLLTIAVLIGFLGLMHLWPDDRLDPRIRHLLATPASSDSDPGNAAFLLYGFNAPRGRDPYEYGRFLTDTYETLGMLPAIADPLQFTIEDTDRISLRREGNADELFAAVDSIPAVLAANAELLSRYRLLSSTPVFTEVIRPEINSPVVPVQQILMAEFLARAEIIYAAETGDTARAWELWHQELAMRRSLLASSNHLLMKSISSVLVSEMVRLRALLLARGHGAGAGAPAAPLSQPEKSVVPAIRFELTALINAWQGAQSRADFLGEGATTLDRLLFTVLPLRLNAFINIHAYELDIIEASLLDTAAFMEWAKAWKAPEIGVLSYLNNGAGLLMIESEFINYQEYIYRLHDLDRVILLGQIAEAMLQAGVGAGDANGWLRSLPEQYRDPFTGERPTWSDGVLTYPAPPVTFDFDRGLDLPLP